jgi:hypothetical protein
LQRFPNEKGHSTLSVIYETGNKAQPRGTA